MSITSGRRSLLIVLLIGCAVAACDLLGTEPHDAVTIAGAQAELRGDTVQFDLQLINSGPREIELTWSCDQRGPMVLRAYDEADRLRWDSSRVPEGGVVCFPIVYTVELPPGGEKVLSRDVLARRILGDSLPAGLYRLSVGPHFYEYHGRDEVSVGEWYLEDE